MYKIEVCNGKYVVIKEVDKEATEITELPTMALAMKFLAELEETENEVD